ncbi:NAD(P)-dependent alcohol dehydrogenase [Flagellimonas lutimaris]|jgi:aryl-alcohol dehydrogenase|uniref:NAD(P)-dependent alcohol dehydrogenase n=1 Tax=Flagellimonas lutimaris TaxID=475082 RepID=UPI003F5CC95F
MEIKAAVLSGLKEEFKVREVQLDNELQSNEVLVKIAGSGICHTDLAVRDGFLPFPTPSILGHEGSGIVEKIGSAVSKVQIGDHVVMAPASCGSCEPCRSGHPSYCVNFLPLNFGPGRVDGSCPYHDHTGQNVNGMFFGQSSFATYSLVAESGVVKVTKDVPIELLGPLGCGIQTGAGSVLNILKPNPGESIIIFGVGSVGLSGIMAAKAAGCTTIIAVDLYESRLEMAMELGATHIINAKNEKAADVVLKRIMPGGVHYAFDTTGINSVIVDALSSLRSLGKLALVIVAGDKLDIDNMVLMGKSIHYSIEGDSVPDVFIPKLINMYQAGIFPFDKLVKYYDLDEINQAIHDAEKGTTIKAILKM